jgi:hypothetical protein
LVSGGADLGDGVNSNQVGIGYILSSIGGKDLNDFYKFSLDSLKLVNFYLSQSGTAAQWWLIQDRNGNGQVDPGEAIKTGTITTKPLDLDVILGAGDYYLQVGSLSSDATSVYAVNVAARSLENQVIASYNSDYYLVQNGQLRLIPNQETLTAMGIAANTVKTFSNQDLTLIPLGKALPSRKDGDVFADLSGNNIYLMESGKRRLLPKGYTLKELGINLPGSPTFPDSDFKDIPLGDPYAPPIPQWQKDIDNTYQYTRNLLGNPTGSYWQAGSSPNGTQGYGQNYDNGTIYWTAQSGAIALWYAFKDTYNQNGGSSGWLGFPTKGKEDWEGGQRIDFEGGYIYWTEKEGAKAYHTGETINRKPVITFPDFQMGYGTSFSLQTYANQLQISDPDGDAIQFYEISVDPSRVDMEASTLEGQPLGKFLIPADQFNTIKFYGSVIGSNSVVVRAFDGKEWSDAKSFNINVVSSSNTGGVAITPGNGGSPLTTSPSPTPEQPISGKGVTIRTGSTDSFLDKNKLEELEKTHYNLVNFLSSIGLNHSAEFLEYYLNGVGPDYAFGKRKVFDVSELISESEATLNKAVELIKSSSSLALQQQAQKKGTFQFSTDIGHFGIIKDFDWWGALGAFKLSMTGSFEWKEAFLGDEAELKVRFSVTDTYDFEGTPIFDRDFLKKAGWSDWNWYAGFYTKQLAEYGYATEYPVEGTSKEYTFKLKKWFGLVPNFIEQPPEFWFKLNLFK